MSKLNIYHFYLCNAFSEATVRLLGRYFEFDLNTFKFKLKIITKTFFNP